MKLGLRRSLVVAGMALSVSVALADIPLPTTVTIFFQKNGEPYHNRVDFSVHCYGWAAYPGEPGFPPGKKPDPYTPKEVYTFSGACPDYGCVIHHSLHLNYRHIDYCDLEGRSDGWPFKIEKFGSSPVGKCSEPPGRSRFEQNCELRLTLPK